MPPEDALKERREKMFREKVEGWVEATVAEILDTRGLKKRSSGQVSSATTRRAGGRRSMLQ
jgi:hypothetical protein